MLTPADTGRKYSPLKFTPAVVGTNLLFSLFIKFRFNYQSQKCLSPAGILLRNTPKTTKTITDQVIKFAVGSGNITTPLAKSQMIRANTMFANIDF